MSAESGSWPFISVVVPTRNRPAQLEDCLYALASQDYPRERFEVLVVDDGSEAPPDKAINRVRDEIDVVLVTQDNAGPATARNVGAFQAKGNLLAFTDDDCRPDPIWLSEFAREFVANRQAALGGRTINALPQNIYSSTSQHLIDFLYERFNSSGNAPTFFTSNNLAIPAQGFREIGGFDTSFRIAAGEDRELCDRWTRRGFAMAYVPSARVLHQHPLSLRKLWRQQSNYGRGAKHFHDALKRRRDAGVRVRPLSFYLGLLCYTFSVERFLRASVTTCLLALTQIATAAGFALESVQKRNSAKNT